MPSLSLSLSRRRSAVAWIGAIALALSLGAAYAINVLSEGYRADPGTTTTVDATPIGGDCKKVVNSHGSNAYFVPTKTTTEWNAFKNNPPSWVAFESCVPPTPALSSYAFFISLANPSGLCLWWASHNGLIGATASGDCYRFSGILLSGSQGVYPGYARFSVSVIGTEGWCSGGAWTIDVAQWTGPYTIAEAWYPGCFSRSWYASDYLTKIEFQSMVCNVSTCTVTMAVSYSAYPGACVWWTDGYGGCLGYYVWQNSPRLTGSINFPNQGW